MKRRIFIKKTLKRLIAIEDDEVAKNLISDAKHKYDETKNMLNKTIDKLSREITTKRITIDNLKRLNANPLLINKMDEIRKDRNLVKTMVDEYIDKITIFRLHELWLLVVVSYKGGEEMWGQLNALVIKKRRWFYDELHCHYGVEFQGWLLNNTERCFRMIKAHILLLIMVKVKYMWNLNQVSMITIHLIK